MLLMTVACSKKPAVAPPVKPIEGALLQKTCGDVTAAWIGKRDDGPGPDWFFTDHLEFHFRSGAKLVMKEQGELEPQHRSDQIFSPDCQWVLLPQDNYGPFHLVKVSELEHYLIGQPKSIAVTPNAQDAGPASVLTEQIWVGPETFEFTASCCGGAAVYRVNAMAAPKLEKVFEAAEAPHGISRRDAGYSVAE